MPLRSTFDTLQRHDRPAVAVDEDQLAEHGRDGPAADGLQHCHTCLLPAHRCGSAGHLGGNQPAEGNCLAADGCALPRRLRRPARYLAAGAIPRIGRSRRASCSRMSTGAIRSRKSDDQVGAHRQCRCKCRIQGPHVVPLIGGRPVACEARRAIALVDRISSASCRARGLGRSQAGGRPATMSC